MPRKAVIHVCTLDVGCGSKLRGEVNLDVNVKHIPTWKLSRGLKEVIVGDAHHLPFRSGAFNKVLCLSVLPYVRNENLVLKELHRALKPEGKLLLTHNSIKIYLKDLRNNPLRQIRNILWRIFLHLVRENFQNPIINTFQTYKGLSRVLRRHGFTAEIVSVDENRLFYAMCTKEAD
ncbi:MAG: class I SAM-dependent methyltransferase [Candidatus Bathyarchaeia archaeon]